ILSLLFCCTLCLAPLPGLRGMALEELRNQGHWPLCSWAACAVFAIFFLRRAGRIAVLISALSVAAIALLIIPLWKFLFAPVMSSSEPSSSVQSEKLALFVSDRLGETEPSKAEEADYWLTPGNDPQPSDNSDRPSSCLRELLAGRSVLRSHQDCGR